MFVARLQAWKWHWRPMGDWAPGRLGSRATGRVRRGLRQGAVLGSEAGICMKETRFTGPGN